MPLTLEIVTPEAKVYSDTIDSVVVPTLEGEIGVLPGHIPLLAQVEHGELRVTKGGVTHWLAVGGGFAQIDGDCVRVLAEPGLLAVEDTGPGLKPEDLARAFERFYLHDRYGRERPVGTGLGLAIVQELANGMGGTVSATSDPGRVTRFELRLPSAPTPALQPV